MMRIGTQLENSTLNLYTVCLDQTILMYMFVVKGVNTAIKNKQVLQRRII